jgi:hypothetical protein
MNLRAKMQALKEQEKLLEPRIEEAQRNLEAVKSELCEIGNQWLSIRNTLVLQKFRTVSENFVEVKTTSKDKRRWQHKTLPRLVFCESGIWSRYLVESPKKYMYGFIVLELAIEAAKTESVKSLEEYYRIDRELADQGIVEFKDLPRMTNQLQITTSLLCLWYFDNDIHFALLTNPADIERAIDLCGEHIGNHDEETAAWLDSLDFEMFRHDTLTTLPEMPANTKVVVFFGY